MNQKTPVLIANEASTFRVYLRNRFYPNNQAIIQNNLYDNIPGAQNIQPSPNMADYEIKCTKRNSVTDYSRYVEQAIINSLLSAFSIYVSNDQEINNKFKDQLMEVYYNISAYLHCSIYMRYLYNAIFFQPNTTTRLLMVIL